MIAFDTHIHTYPFSQDSHQQIEEVLAAKKKTSYGYVLTEHMDYNYTGPYTFEFEPRDYFNRYAPYRDDHFLLGVEMGLQTNALGKIAKTVSDYPFDMVIGSIHSVSEDISFPEFYTKFHKKEAYQRYLVTMLDCLEQNPPIDALGHMDYICRYSTYDDPELHIAEHKAALEAIFNYIISHHICLEINTRRLNSSQGFQTLNELLRLYHYLGGRLVTVGSDAHRTTDLSAHFDLADKLIAEHDFTPVYFKNRVLHEQ